MKHLAASVVFLALSGCATKEPDYRWYKQSAGSSEFNQDSGQCRAQAFSVLGPMIQKVIVYESCLQGKGWQKQAM